MLPFTTYNIPETIKYKTPDLPKWLLIVTRDKILGENEELLRKICSALKADFESDVALIQSMNNDQSFEQFVHNDHVKLILSFGVSPAALGIWIDLNLPGIRFLETFAFILTADIVELSKSPNAKKQLWGFMQSFLELK